MTPWAPAIPWEDNPSRVSPLDAEFLNDAFAEVAAYAEALAAGGVVLDSVRLTSGWDRAEVVGAPYAVPGSTINFPVGTRPILFKLYVPQMKCEAAIGGGVLLKVDGSNTGLIGGAITGATGYVQGGGERLIDDLAAGDHSASLAVFTSDAAHHIQTGGVGNGTGTNAPPILFYAWEG